MNKKPYTKKALPFAGQVALLRDRGMEIRDEAEAAFYLSHINYYRLTAYWLPFEEDHATHQFREGTNFDQVLNLYIFDRELRLLVMDALERIEVSVRTQWAFHMGNGHGSHAQMETALAHCEDRWKLNLHALKKEVNRADEVFIEHFKATYEEVLPPVWVISEVMSLSLLSRWYANLRPMATRRRIASTYFLDEGLLESWLHHLTIVRNICAHHGRLWNRSFTVTPGRPRSNRLAIVRESFQSDSTKLYNSLLIILHFMDQVSPGNHWRQRLKDLITAHRVPVDHMGFPEGWESLAIWKGRTT
jgi:abortive infection bacteriophage resistance protein